MWTAGTRSAATASVGGGPAFASEIYSHAGTWLGTFTVSSDGGLTRIAAPFTITEDVTVSKILLQTQSPGAVRTGRIRFHSDSAGEPGSQVGSNVDVDVEQVTEQEFECNQALTGPGTFWVSFENRSSAGGQAWTIKASNETDGAAKTTTNGGSSWTTYNVTSQDQQVMLVIEGF